MDRLASLLINIIVKSPSQPVSTPGNRAYANSMLCGASDNSVLSKDLEPKQNFKSLLLLKIAVIKPHEQRH
ncbi:hypothetical protein Tco_0200498 [Tanacetum coccineum]